MIEVKSVDMCYPHPKRYVEYLLHPLKRTSVTALSQVDLRVSVGDAVAILGANGAGKTTLLKLIGGLLYPTRGTIVVNGHDTVTDNFHARNSVGYVLNDDRSFYWRLTGTQNLEFFGSLENLSGRQLKLRIEELLRITGLWDARKRRVSDYSSGMRQRLAIARGLLANPEILILDEPTKSLDPSGAEDMRTLIRNTLQGQNRKTLIIATHQTHEVEELCNKVCVIQEGRVLSYTTVDRVRSQHESVLAYYRSMAPTLHIQ